MKCFLHIGTEKTATTTIQNFLNLNRSEFFKKGFIYTKSAGKNNNFKLPMAAYDLKRRDHLTKILGLNTDNELSEFQDNIISSLKEEIEEETSNNPDLKIIFSSELFQSRLTTLEELHRLHEILYGLGIDEIRVIVYLRNPAELANSLFSTSIKYGYNVGEVPPTPKDPYYANICNHQKTLEKFGSVFGEDVLIPRIFHTTELKNGTIIDDFMEVIGAPIDAAYNIPEYKNKSFSVTGIHLLKRINKIFPCFIDDRYNPIRANIASYIEKYFSDSKYAMPSYLYEQYDLEFYGSNEWVRKKYFPDKKNLFPETQYPKESRLNIPDSELDRIANLIVHISIDKQNQITKLTRGLTRST